MVATVPSSALCASVVECPSMSNAQSPGIGTFFLLAAMMLPRATFDVARSTLIGYPLPVGNEQAIGFVPKKASEPPSGAIAGSEVVMARRVQFWAAARLQ